METNTRRSIRKRIHKWRSLQDFCSIGGALVQGAFLTSCPLCVYINRPHGLTPGAESPKTAFYHKGEIYRESRRAAKRLWRNREAR